MLVETKTLHILINFGFSRATDKSLFQISTIEKKIYFDHSTFQKIRLIFYYKK